jgi:uncharacterized protein YlaI
MKTDVPKMKTYSDVEEFRASEEAVNYAAAWLDAQRRGDVASDYHMNLLAWTSANPFHVLAIVMDLIDQVDDDEVTAEMVALGPVEWLCEHCDDEFVQIISEAIRMHSGFARFTKWKRDNSNDPAWVRFRRNPSPNNPW